MEKLIKQWMLLGFLFSLFGLFFYLDLYQYLSFSILKSKREILLAWTQAHIVLAILGFSGVYIVSVAAFIPGASFLTITAGFLFGPWLATSLVVLSATVGAFIVFIAVERALREWLLKKTVKWIKKMEDGLKKNPFSYLLFIRLLPIFPFWLVNVVPALLGVPRQVYVMATFLGIIPGSFIYVMVGSGLGDVFDSNETPNIEIIFDLKILLPILALALLSLLPIGCKYIIQRRKSL